MWCPRCQRQYEDGIDVCIQCGCELEDYTPILAEDERDLLETEETDQVDPLLPSEDLIPELLASVVGEEEAKRLSALLEGLRIPCLCKPSEEEFPMTDEQTEQETIYDLLVPKMLVPKALKVLEADSADQEENLLDEDLAAVLAEDEEDEQEEGEENPQPKARKRWFEFFRKKEK